MKEDGQFATAVLSGEFVLTAECRPPRGADAGRLTTCAAALGSAVHAISVPESEDGPRLSSLAACAQLKAAGVDPILHVLTRDLNRIALQSAVLGAASLGIRNVLCVTGRHQTLTRSSSARGVFDVDPPQFLRIANDMRKEGRLADGQMLDSPVDLFLGADANPFAEPIELHLIAVRKAVSAGADFVITQPVFDIERFEAWMAAVRERGIHERTCVIAGVMPLTSQEQAAELSRNVRSLHIPERVIEVLTESRDARASGLGLAIETMVRVREIEGVRGIHLMTGEDVNLAAEVLSAAGIARK